MRFGDRYDTKSVKYVFLLHKRLGHSNHTQGYNMKKLTFAACCFGIFAMASAPTTQAQTQQVRVEIQSNAPDGGVALTPLWVGFHNGSFDSYNGGLSSQEGLERIAEDGNASVLSGDFLAGRTYVQGGVSGLFDTAQTTGRIDGLLAAPSGPPPIQPGESSSAIFSIDATDNQFFSYASMVLPSNDYYVANGNPTAFDLSSLFSGGGPISFNIGLPGTVNDAGTELNDFATSAANGLFGISGGQSGPNEGADENGVNANVAGDPFAGFANLSNANGVDLASLNFNDANLYANGIATVTITAVPEPSGIALLGLGFSGLFLRRRRG